jgi:hypothetical protein
MLTLQPSAGRILEIARKAGVPIRSTIRSKKSGCPNKKKDNNDIRPQSALGYPPPTVFARKIA